MNGVYSEWAHVKRGVPQGSVLGPILFVLYINDMPKIVENTCKLFADDAKLSGKATNNLTEWSLTWQLPFDYGKCKCLHIGKSNPKYDYVMHGRTLEKVDCEKDLGVEVYRELKFHKHTSSSVKKANRMLGLIKRSFQKKRGNFPTFIHGLGKTPTLT